MCAFDAASRQLGLITREQARGLGLSDGVIASLIRRGQWRRVHPSVYTVAGAPASWSQRVLAAVLAGGRETLGSHLTAGSAYGLDGVDRGLVEVTRPGVVPMGLQQVIVHRSVLLEPIDRALVDGIPMTSVARTLADCSGPLSLGRLARALDSALVRNLVKLEAVVEVADRLGPAPGRKISNLRRLLAERGAEADTAGSRPEMRLFRVLREAKVREPVSQFEVRCGPDRFYLDAAYPDELVDLEYQGFDPHRTRTAFDRDARRGRALTAAGWRVAYFTSRDSDADIVAAVRAFGI